MKTAMEKVYMAKLDVVSSAPKTCTTHWLLSVEAALESNRAARAAAPFSAVFATHGVVLSDHKTPPSLASCSKVTGTKEPYNAISSRFPIAEKFAIPIPHTAYTSAAKPYA